jgi:hypothetical protein
VTDSNDDTGPNDASTDSAKPNWRPMALALVAANSDRFTDWDSDRVVPVAPPTED